MAKVWRNPKSTQGEKSRLDSALKDGACAASGVNGHVHAQDPAAPEPRPSSSGTGASRPRAATPGGAGRPGRLHAIPPGDAVKAAYDALAAGITALLEDPAPLRHEALVVAIYRDLVPAGRLPLAVPGVLARLNDLGSLERMGVAVGPELARGVLEEVSDWVHRL